MKNADDVVKADLDFIAGAGAGAELAAMSGKRLMIAGGAGFLGYYLVQGALNWNRVNADMAPISVLVLDNFIRGVPAWLTALGKDKNLATLKHDITNPLPASLGDLDFIIHAASIASPIYYRKYPIETMDANINGLAFHARILPGTEADVASRCPASCSTRAARSTAIRHPTNIPTPETYRGNVSCTGPRACYDESKRYGETLCVNFAKQHGVPVQAWRGRSTTTARD